MAAWSLSRSVGSARYYDPQLGRWPTVDPADEYFSPFCYVGNNPILFIDFFGMSSDENIPYWGYTETINVYGDRVDPSWYNPGG